MTDLQSMVDALPKLKVKVKTIREIDCFDVERFLEEVFGIEQKGYSGGVSLVADHEWSNDSMYTIYVHAPEEGEDPVEYFNDEYGEGTFENLEALYTRKAKDKTGKWLSSSAMLDFLAWKGWIATGEYTVDVMW